MSIIKRIKELPYIKKDNFSLLFPDIKPSSFDQNIKNWLKSKEIIKLKRGFYVSGKYWENCANKEEYLYYLASMLFSPSYISKESVLARYGILSEAVFGVSSVTDRGTKNYNSTISNFSYTKIKPKLFVGYSEQKIGDKSYFIASKSKALFDYLYFHKRLLRRINKKVVEELRLNLEGFTLDDWQEFEKYSRLANSEKLRRIYKILRKYNAL